MLLINKPTGAYFLACAEGKLLPNFVFLGLALFLFPLQIEHINQEGGEHAKANAA